MQPVDRALGNVFGHAFDGVVVRPAVVAIEIALPFRKQVRNDRPQVVAVPARFEIGRAPGLPGADRVKLLIFRLVISPGFGFCG